MKTSRTVVGVDTAKRVFQLYWVDMETGEIMVVETLREQWACVARLDAEVGEIERRLKLWHRDIASSRRTAEIPGVGVLSATAAVAAMGDPAAFKSGREFAAWLGLEARVGKFHRGQQAEVLHKQAGYRTATCCLDA